MMKTINRVIALLLTAVMMSQSVQANPIVPTRSPAFSIAIPRTLGFVTDTYQPVGTQQTRPAFILIQNLHVNRSVQFAISGLLKQLKKEALLSGPVAVEGATGPMDIASMQHFPDAVLRKKAADYLVKEGEMPGAMHFAVTEGQGELYGVENPDTYQANLEMFRRSYKERTQLYAALDNIKATLPTLKKDPHVRANALILEKDLNAVMALLNNQVTSQDLPAVLRQSAIALDHLKAILPADQSAPLLESLSASINFYALAFLRDEDMFKNALALHQSTHQQTTILITGGFHTPGLTEQCKRLGLSYVVIMPVVKQHGLIDQKLYVERLLGHHLTPAQLATGLDWVSAQKLEPTYPEEKAEFVAATSGVVMGRRHFIGAGLALALCLLPGCKAPAANPSRRNGTSPHPTASPLTDPLVINPPTLPDAAPTEPVVAPQVLATLATQNTVIEHNKAFSVSVHVTKEHELQNCGLLFSAFVPNAPEKRTLNILFRDAQGRVLHAQPVTWVRQAPQRFLVNLADLKGNVSFDWTQLHSIQFQTDNPHLTLMHAELVDLEAVREKGFSVGLFGGGLDVEKAQRGQEADDGNTFAPYNGLDRRSSVRRKPVSVLSYTALDEDPKTLLQRWQGLDTNGQIPFDTLEFSVPDKSDSAEARTFIRRYGRRTYNTLLQHQKQKTVLIGVANGDYDQIIRDQAHTAAAFQKPLILRLFHEFNGHSAAWSLQNSGDTQRFIDAWKHVRQLYQDEHANNVVWMFAPSTYEPAEMLTLEKKVRYQATAHILEQIQNEVDLVGLSVYQRSDTAPNFNEAATGLIEVVRGANKPIVLAEFGSASDAPSQEYPDHTRKQAFWHFFMQDIRAGLFPEVLGGWIFSIRKNESTTWFDFRPDVGTAETLQQDSFFSKNPLRTYVQRLVAGRRQMPMVPHHQLHWATTGDSYRNLVPAYDYSGIAGAFQMTGEDLSRELPSIFRTLDQGAIVYGIAPVDLDEIEAWIDSHERKTGFNGYRLTIAPSLRRQIKRYIRRSARDDWDEKPLPLALHKRSPSGPIEVRLQKDVLHVYQVDFRNGIRVESHESTPNDSLDAVMGETLRMMIPQAVKALQLDPEEINRLETEIQSVLIEVRDLHDHLGEKDRYTNTIILHRSLFKPGMETMLLGVLMEELDHLIRREEDETTSPRVFKAWLAAVGLEAVGVAIQTIAPSVLREVFLEHLSSLRGLSNSDILAELLEDPSHIQNIFSHYWEHTSHHAKRDQSGRPRLLSPFDSARTASDVTAAVDQLRADLAQATGHPERYAEALDRLSDALQATVTQAELRQSTPATLLEELRSVIDPFYAVLTSLAVTKQIVPGKDRTEADLFKDINDALSACQVHVVIAFIHARVPMPHSQEAKATEVPLETVEQKILTAFQKIGLPDEKNEIQRILSDLSRNLDEISTDQPIVGYHAAVRDLTDSTYVQLMTLAENNPRNRSVPEISAFCGNLIDALTSIQVARCGEAIRTSRTVGMSSREWYFDLVKYVWSHWGDIAGLADRERLMSLFPEVEPYMQDILPLLRDNNREDFYKYVFTEIVAPQEMARWRQLFKDVKNNVDSLENLFAKALQDLLANHAGGEIFAWEDGLLHLRTWGPSHAVSLQMLFEMAWQEGLGAFIASRGDIERAVEAVQAVQVAWDRNENVPYRGAPLGPSRTVAMVPGALLEEATADPQSTPLDMIFHEAQGLASKGRYIAAETLLDNLIDHIHEAQRAGPGPLMAWVHERHPDAGVTIAEDTLPALLKRAQIMRLGVELPDMVKKADRYIQSLHHERVTKEDVRYEVNGKTWTRILQLIDTVVIEDPATIPRVRARILGNPAVLAKLALIYEHAPLMLGAGTFKEPDADKQDQIVLRLIHQYIADDELLRFLTDPDLNLETLPYKDGTLLEEVQKDPSLYAKAALLRRVILERYVSGLENPAHQEAAAAGIFRSMVLDGKLDNVDQQLNQLRRVSPKKDVVVGESTFFQGLIDSASLSVIPYLFKAYERGETNVEIPLDLLPFDPAKRLPDEISAAERLRIRAMAELLGMNLTVHSPIVGPQHPSTGFAAILEDAADNVDMMKDVVDFAGDIGAKVVVVHISDRQNEGAWDRYAEIAKHAARHRAWDGSPLKIGFENYMSKALENKSRPFPTLDEHFDAFAEVARRVAREDPKALKHTALLLDSAHFNLTLQLQDPLEAAYRVYERAQGLADNPDIARALEEEHISKEDFVKGLIAEVHLNQNIGPILFTIFGLDYGPDIHDDVERSGSIANDAFVALLFHFGFRPIVLAEQKNVLTPAGQKYLEDAATRGTGIESVADIEARGRAAIQNLTTTDPGFYEQTRGLFEDNGDHQIKPWYAFLAGLFGIPRFEEHMVARATHQILNAHAMDPAERANIPHLMEGVSLVHVGPGETVIKQGTTLQKAQEQGTNKAYLIVDGSMRVLATATEGHTVLDKTLQPGVPVGEAIIGEGLFISSEHVRKATVQGGPQGATLLALDEPVFWFLYTHIPSFRDRVDGRYHMRDEEIRQTTEDWRSMPPLGRVEWFFNESGVPVPKDKVPMLRTMIETLIAQHPQGQHLTLVEVGNHGSYWPLLVAVAFPDSDIDVVDVDNRNSVFLQRVYERSLSKKVPGGLIGRVSFHTIDDTIAGENLIPRQGWFSNSMDDAGLIDAFAGSRYGRDAIGQALPSRPIPELARTRALPETRVTANLLSLVKTGGTIRVNEGTTPAGLRIDEAALLEAVADDLGIHLERKKTIEHADETRIAVYTVTEKPSDVTKTIRDIGFEGYDRNSRVEAKKRERNKAPRPVGMASGTWSFDVFKAVFDYVGNIDSGELETSVFSILQSYAHEETEPYLEAILYLLRGNDRKRFYEGFFKLVVAPIENKFWHKHLLAASHVGKFERADIASDALDEMQDAHNRGEYFQWGSNGQLEYEKGWLSPGARSSLARLFYAAWDKGLAVLDAGGSIEAAMIVVEEVHAAWDANAEREEGRVVGLASGGMLQDRAQPLPPPVRFETREEDGKAMVSVKVGDQTLDWSDLRGTTYQSTEGLHHIDYYTSGILGEFNSYAWNEELRDPQKGTFNEFKKRLQRRDAMSQRVREVMGRHRISVSELQQNNLDNSLLNVFQEVTAQSDLYVLFKHKKKQIRSLNKRDQAIFDRLDKGEAVSAQDIQTLNRDLLSLAYDKFIYPAGNMIDLLAPLLPKNDPILEKYGYGRRGRNEAAVLSETTKVKILRLYYLPIANEWEIDGIKEILRYVYKKHGMRFIAGHWAGMWSFPDMPMFGKGSEAEKQSVIASGLKQIELYGREPGYFYTDVGNENDYHLFGGPAWSSWKRIPFAGVQEYYEFMVRFARAIKAKEKEMGVQHPVLLGVGSQMLLGTLIFKEGDIDERAFEQAMQRNRRIDRLIRSKASAEGSFVNALNEILFDPEFPFSIDIEALEKEIKEEKRRELIPEVRRLLDQARNHRFSADDPRTSWLNKAIVMYVYESEMSMHLSKNMSLPLETSEVDMIRRLNRPSREEPEPAFDGLGVNFYGAGPHPTSGEKDELLDSMVHIGTLLNLPVVITETGMHTQTNEDPIAEDYAARLTPIVERNKHWLAGLIWFAGQDEHWKDPEGKAEANYGLFDYAGNQKYVINLFARFFVYLIAVAAIISSLPAQAETPGLVASVAVGRSFDWLPIIGTLILLAMAIVRRWVAWTAYKVEQKIQREQEASFLQALLQRVDLQNLSAGVAQKIKILTEEELPLWIPPVLRNRLSGKLQYMAWNSAMAAAA